MAETIISGAELWQWYQAAKTAAIAADVAVYELDWLMREVANLDSLTLRLQSFKDQPQIHLSISLARLQQLWQQRLLERQPVQYLVGKVHWRQFALTVAPGVLIPRPETECLIDIALAAGKSLTAGHWVDLGTGSGAIAIALAAELPDAKIHAIDRSSQALAIAQNNAEKLGLARKIQFYQGLWWQPLATLAGKVSAMVSNPPYIPSSAIASLQPEVAKHEPHLALDGGEDGLDCLRHLISTAPAYLHPGGIWLVETMAGQANIVADLLSLQGSYQNIQTYADLAGIERFVLGIRC